MRTLTARAVHPRATFGLVGPNRGRGLVGFDVASVWVETKTTSKPTKLGGAERRSRLAGTGLETSVNGVCLGQTPGVGMAFTNGDCYPAGYPTLH